MLEFKKIENSDEKIDLLKDFDIESGIWIVPHLQIKHDLQNFYINSQKSLIGDPFKTMIEFQEEILLSCYPEIQIVSENIIQTFIKNELKTHQERQYHFSGSAHTVFKLLSHLLPIFSHIEGPELLSELIQKNPNIKKKWGRHLLEAMKVWKKLKNQFVMPSWIPTLLVYKDIPIHQKTIVVDMGCDLLTSEMEMFEKLAKNNHIVILHPNSFWFQKYPNEFFAYNHQKSISSLVTTHDLSKKNIISKRFTSMLTEIKDAVDTARQWIDQGIDPNQIVISAPSIKTYLPALKTYLEFENIPYNPSFITEVHSLPDIARWISKIQVQLKPNVQPYALELAVFADQNAQNMTYTDFHHFYRQILDPEDYKRSEVVYNNFIKNETISRDTKLTAFEFLKYACQLWDKTENSIEEVQQILNIFIRNTKRLPLLRASYWLDVLESIVSITNIKPSQSYEGIYLSNFSTANHLSAKKVYLMGVSEQELKGERYSLLNNLDISSINDQLGFFLEPVEKAPLEFYADWMISNPSIDKVISFPETNFIGEVLTPSILWLNHSWHNYQKEVKFSKRSYATQIDQLQLQNLKIANAVSISGQSHQQTINPILKNILQDKRPSETLTYTPPSLSVGSLERYHKCPFIFYMEDILKVKSPITLDIDMNPLTQGSLTHALLAALTEEPFRSDWTDQQLDDLIEEHLVKEKISLGEKAFKTSFKTMQIKKLQEFLQFEKDWRKKFPQTQTLLRESKIQAYIDSKGQISHQPFEGAILIKGRLDRLDKVADNAFSIIDYKASFFKKTNYKTWLKNSELQLGLYALMIKNNCLEGFSGDVASAVYLGIKEMERNKGFLLEEYNGSAHDVNNRSSHKMNIAQQKDFFQDIQKEIAQIIFLILQGNFLPHPWDKSLCQTCQWRNVCKAPHLK